MYVGRVLDRVEDDGAACQQMMGCVLPHRAAKRVRINLVNPVDHDDGIVHAAQFGLREVEPPETWRRPALETRQQASGTEHTFIDIEAKTLLERQMPDDVSEAAADFYRRLSFAGGPR